MSSTSLPEHVAIILDGNGRWAVGQSVERIEGHKAGAENAKVIMATAIETGIKHLTLFCFSSENWRRGEEEVSALMGLMEESLTQGGDELLEKDVRLRVIGDLSRLSASAVASIEELEAKTAGCKTLNLMIALNYGGRWDMTQSAKALAEKACSGAIKPADITEDMITNHLSTSGIPDPDLLIRSGGELRISNFLLWQLAYSELVFSDKTWPSFTKADFEDSLKQYAMRVRRFGG